MREAGLDPSPDLEVNGHFDLEGGRDSTRLLLARRPDVTAIFAASDEMAMGVMMAARELGLRIPEDLSVIGIDGHDLGELVGLTTMAQAARDQGITAATLLLELITGAPAPADVVFPTTLVVRGSTAPPSLASVPQPGVPTPSELDRRTDANRA
jgi:LacI family repressor for deo operon, udp, cdd, tsx, nupC, and nupG